MLFIQALCCLLITFATSLTTASPAVYHNGTNVDNKLQTRSPGATENEPAIGGDHLIRVNVFPREGCTYGPTTFDFVGQGGTECWDYSDNAESIQVTASGCKAEMYKKTGCSGRSDWLMNDGCRNYPGLRSVKVSCTDKSGCQWFCRPDPGWGH